MTGKIIKFWSDVVEVKFDRVDLPSLNHILTLHNNTTFLLVKRLVNETTIRAIIIYLSSEIKINDVVTNTKRSFVVPVGKNSKNNIYSFEGKPLLTNRNANSPLYVEVDSTINKSRFFDVQAEVIQTGIKAIDFFIPIIKGFKLGFLVEPELVKLC